MSRVLCLHFSPSLISLPSVSFIEMYLRPPSASEEARINDWIKVRQSGIRYYLSLGDQRIVDKHFIIRPKAEFEVRIKSYIWHKFAKHYVHQLILSNSSNVDVLNHWELYVLFLLCLL